MDIKSIILRSVYGSISEEEEQELSQWLGIESNKRLYEKIRHHLESRDTVEFLAGIDTERALCRAHRRLRRPMLAITLAAASVAAMILIGLFVWSLPETTSVVPESPRGATLTLASGEVLQLDGTMVDHRTDKDARIEVAGETIKIHAGKKIPAAPVYNTLNVPHGESYCITLAEGTRVWVNAMSSLKFPSSFEGEATRTVELSGEGYFKVARDTVHPFRVITLRQTIVVTGTEFNVTAYADEVNRTTLCSGSVTVETSEGKPIYLRPGQQLSITTTGETTVTEVNTEMYTAWRTGEYYFDNQTLGEVFLTLGRWFDIREVDFSDPATERQLFSGKLKKSDGLETILKVIQRGCKSRIEYKDGKIEIGKE